MIQGILRPELKEARIEIERIAREECNLDSFPVLFVLTDFDTLMEVTANTGMPKRYPHWHFGMQQKYFEKTQGYGLSHIYELVINTDPSIAYLLDTNPPVIQKMVMAHVFGHANFFKNNYLFEKTNRNMHNVMADHAERIRFYQQKHGYQQVEKFIEVCLSIDNLIDHLAFPYDPRPLERKEKPTLESEDCSSGSCDSCSGCPNSGGCGPEGDDEEEDWEEYRLKVSKPYMEPFVNPEKFIDEMKKVEKKRQKADKRFPKIPQRDVLRFVLKHGEGMKPWQRNILSIIRDESYYFAPQRRTKIMNEGWAVYWHKHIMEDWGIAADDDLIEYARVNGGVLATAPGQINPYHIGYLVWKDIKDRWDKGKHGIDYLRETNRERREKWDTGDMQGLEKMFEVRDTMDDIEFLNTFFNDEFIEKNKFFNYDLDQTDQWYKISDRNADRIRQRLIAPMFNSGEPFIEVINGNFHNSRELLLRHVSYDGTILERDKMRKTMKNLFKVWGRNVHLVTNHGDNSIIVSFNGKQFKAQKLNGD